MNLEDGMLLYHGSYAPVRHVDLAMCSVGKDFGRGFYLTSSKEQARRFIGTSLRKAQSIGAAPRGQSHGFVSSFLFSAPTSPLSTYQFPTANDQWLWFVASNRRAALAQALTNMLDPALADADVIIGKVANDATNPVITTYLNGLYGPIADPSSAKIAIGLLLPDRLTDQYCFLSECAIQCLEPVEVIRYEP